MAATSPSVGEAASSGAITATRWDELRVFLLLTVVLAPVLAVMIVGGYGFLIWMYQIVAGPPGAPAL